MATAAQNLYLVSRRQIFQVSFLVTVCKMIRYMLLDRCPVSVSLSVMLVYCGQTVGWIKMKLGKSWHGGSLGPGHIVLDGDPAPPQRGTAP